MVNQPLRRMFSRWPSAPANSATIILFTTHPRIPTGGTVVQASSIPGLMPANFGPTIGPGDIEGLTITWHKNNQASAANGLRLYTWNETDQAWYESDAKDLNGAATIGSSAPVQVPVLSSGQEFFKRYDTSKYAGFCFEYTAGTKPTNWLGTVIPHINSSAFHLLHVS